MPLVSPSFPTTFGVYVDTATPNIDMSKTSSNHGKPHNDTDTYTPHEIYNPLMVVDQEGDIAHSMEGIQSTTVIAGVQHDTFSVRTPRNSTGSATSAATTPVAVSTSSSQRDVQRRTLHKKKSSYDLRDDFRSSAPTSRRPLEGL